MAMDKFYTDNEDVNTREQNDDQDDEDTVVAKPKGVVKKIGKK